MKFDMGIMTEYSLVFPIALIQSSSVGVDQQDKPLGGRLLHSTALSH